MHTFFMDSKLKTSRVLLFLLLVCSQAYFLFGLKEKDFQCRRRLYYTNVSWYTAYDICKGNKMELERLDKDITTFSFVLKAYIDEVFKFLNNFNKSELEVWIGALVRTSTNASMDSHCKFLNHHFNYTVSEEDILCVYFDVSTDKFHTANCSNSKSFLCVIPKNEKSNCLMPTIKTTANSLLCKNKPVDLIMNETMEDKLLNSSDNYAITFNSTHYTQFQYKAMGCVETDQMEGQNMGYTSKSKIMTPERLQEKIDIIQKNLTVGRKNTTKYQRTLTSAPDDRPSSKYMGITGVFIICLFPGFIILIDLSNLYKKFKPVRVKIE